MNQDSDPAILQQSSTALQEYPACSDPSRGVRQQFDDEKPLGLPLQLPLFLDFPKPQKKGIDRVLGRLSCMEFPGKGYVEEYLRYQYRRGFKFSTLRGTLTACDLFLSFLREDGKAGLEQITRQDIEAFVEHELDRGLKILTVQTRLTAVYAFLRFLHERGVVEAELLVRKIKLRLPDPLPKAINPEDVKRLLSVVDHVRNRAMILALLRTGMRIGELLNTRVSDVNLEEQKIAIWEAEKNLVGRVVCISDDAAWALGAWLSKRDPNKGILFYGRGHSPLTYQGARVMFGKYLKKAGLTHKRYTLHCLRHTFATEVLNAGMRLEAVQVLLGHSNAEVTRRYARLSDKTREDEYFKAMEIIERGDIDGDYRLDS
jgi:integrase/recombinase XerD